MYYLNTIDANFITKISDTKPILLILLRLSATIIYTMGLTI
jgi:hypothetical protein